jgi:hypothetical protein
MSPLEKAALSVEFIGFEAAWASPELGEPLRYCTEDALKKSDVATQCNDFANLLVRRGGTLLDFGVGQHLGKRLGWPEARLSDLSREESTLSNQLPKDEPNPWSCESVARINEFLEKRVQLGELQALRYFRDTAH